MKTMKLWLILALAFMLPVNANALNVTETGATVAINGGLDLAAPMGTVTGVTSVNKYGRAVDGVQTTATDIWDRADATPTQQIWLAPTAARIHTIVSSNGNDACADQLLTLAANPSDGDTFTIGTKTYTLQTTLTDVDGNIKIGAAIVNTLDNMVAALNLAAGAGTTYAASMTANAASIVATEDGESVLTVFDQDNAILATTETGANISWGAATTVAGTGAAKIRVWYLPTWSTAETTEDVVLHGVAGVAMTNSAVMINRMKVIYNGAQYNENAGNITATAATDSTVTAQISATFGQTEMAIYGLPSTKTAYLTGYHVGGHDTAAPTTSRELDFLLLVNEAPDVNPTTFIQKSMPGVNTLGNADYRRNYRPFFKVAGPAIIKVQATSSAADTEGTAEFDLLLIDN